MEVIGILLKSGVSIDLDEGTELSMVVTQEQSNYSTGIMSKVNTVDDRVNLTDHVRIDSIKRLKFYSNGSIWVIDQNEVAGIKYKENIAEKEQFKKEVKL